MNAQEVAAACAIVAIKALHDELGKGADANYLVARDHWFVARAGGAEVLPGSVFTTADLDELFADEEVPV
jgi:hypothetical protein